MKNRTPAALATFRLTTLAAAMAAAFALAACGSGTTFERNDAPGYL